MKQHKDAAGNAYYLTEDRKYLVMKDQEANYWNVLKYSYTPDRIGFIYDGYSLKWDGFKRLKDAKGYVAELIAEEVEA